MQKRTEGEIMSVKRYRKKPVVIEAVQWAGGNLAEVQEFVGIMQNMDGDASTVRFFAPFERDDDGEVMHADGLARLWVEANTTWLPVEVGEWILKDSRGFYPCKADVFADTYEEVKRFAIG
jgi:hypothetical protein